MNTKKTEKNSFVKNSAYSQHHGKIFEDFIKATYPGASDQKRNSTSRFDIEGIYDKEKHLNTSIKSKKQKKNGKETFEMADARRFFSLDEDFRLIVGLYKQDEDKKTFLEIIEYIIKKEDINKLKGDLSYSDVNDFHNTIRSLEYGKEGQRKGQLFCKKNKQNLEAKTLMILNPKIDSKNQRRLQCSIKREILECILPESQIIRHSESYRELCLPLTIKSKARRF